MRGRQWGRIIAGLAGGMLLFAACGGQENIIPTPALNTPVPQAAQAGQGFPSEIVVIVVTPTPAEGEGGAAPESQGGQESEGQQEAQGDQPTPEASGEGGGGAQEGEGEESSGGESSGDAESSETPESSNGSESEGSGSEGSESEASSDGAAEMSEEELISTGEQVYAAECETCHQAEGEGTDTYPALAGSDIATAEDPSEAITTVVEGRGEMPGFGDQLAPEEIAAVLSYVRTSWGNEAPVVEVAQVEGGGEQEQQPEDEPQGDQQTGDQQASDQQGDGQQSGDQQEGDQAAQGEASPSDAGAEQEESQPVAEPIQIQIQIVVMTPEPAQAEEAQAASPSEEASPTPGNDTAQEATPMPGEAAAGAAASTPEASSEEAAAAEETMPTPEGEGEQAQAAPAAEGGDAAQTGDQALIGMGEQVYVSNCASCHQLSGDGDTIYPPLNGNALVTDEDPAPAINVVLHGRGEMPSFDGFLADQEIAAVLSYIRNSWDNQASVVTVEQLTQAEGSEQPQEEQDAAQQGAGQPSSDQQDSAQQEGDQAAQAGAATPTPSVAGEGGQPSAEPGSAETGISVEPGQTIQIQIVIVPAASQEGAASQGETAAPPEGETEATPTPEEGQAADDRAQPAEGEDTAEATPPPEEGEPEAEGSEGEAPPAAEATPAPEGESGGDDALPDDMPAGEPQVPEGGSGAGQEEGDEEEAEAEPDEEASANTGPELYARYCAACHQEAGQGVEGAYPPLAGNPFVRAEDPSSVIDVVLTGRAGMPHFGAYLETEQIAAVVAFIRNAWGNQAPAPTVEQVNQIAETVTFEEDGH